jgi:phosphotransferase system enzyme I (PtsI)
MASDPEFTRLLLGLGLRQFSMEPSSLLKIKQCIRQTELEPLLGVVRDILDCVEPGALHSLVDHLNQA